MDQLPPPLPLLRSTPSIGGGYSGSRSFGSSKTKLNLVVNALVESVIPAATKKKGAKFRVISFSNTASLFEGTMDEVSTHVKTFTHSGGTNFGDVFKLLAENKVKEREVVILLTDGFDSDRGRRDEYLTNVGLRASIPNLVAIGTEGDVDVNFLKHLSGDLSFTFSTNQDEISTAIKALCFSGFNSVQAENIEFTFWCKDNGVFFPTDENVSYEKTDSVDATEYPPSPLFTYDCGQNGINILSTNSSPVKDEDVMVTFCVDTSGSMGDMTYFVPAAPIYTSSQVDTTGFIKIKVKTAMVDDLYRLFWKGVVVKATVSYTDPISKMSVMESIQLTPTYSEKTFDVGFQSLRILRGLTTNTPVEDLYRENMNFLTTLEDVPEFMVAFGEKIYESLRKLRRAQMNPYERFMDQAPPTMTQLVHTLSAAASDNSSGVVSNTKNTECSVCMSEEATMITLPCKHTGTCKDCFQRLFETNPVCPFCRVSFEKVIEVSSLRCPCDRPANRVGTNMVDKVERCGHALACERASCRKEMDGKLYCVSCDDFVDSFKIYFC